MTRYTARCSREGRWWLIDVEGIGVTQVRRLDQAEAMARDLIYALLDVDSASVSIDLEVDPGPDVDTELIRLREARERLDVAQRDASDTASQVAARLVASGLTVRDVGVLLGVSHQRVSQLLAAVPRPDRKAG